MQKKYEIITHTADVGIKVYGENLEELFINSAYGMYNIICENFHLIEQLQKYSGTVTGPDYETLLVSYLNDLIYQTYVNNLLFSEFKILYLTKKENFIISYTCLGEIYNKNKHGVLYEIKSATFHNLEIKHNVEAGFEVSIIFDT